MEPFPTFPSNKTYAMHSRHQSPVDNFITARFPNPKTSHLSPSNVSILTYNPPDTIDDALALSQTPPPVPSRSSKTSSPTRQPLPRSQSSSWWMEIRKSPSPKREPTSRKTTDATIRTDATETQPAFESDAFAVHMPTTREPILDPPIFRAKLPSPSKAQVEAYQTYKQKAQQVRERQRSEGVRIPSKIVSYDYAYANATAHPQPLRLDLSPPNSPPNIAPAGSFPPSPPIPQHGWARAAQHIQGPRSMSDGSHLNISRKPVGTSSHQPNAGRPRYYTQTSDTDVGASRSTPSPKPAAIKVRLKPRGQDATDRPPKESWWGLYNRSPQSSTDGSRSPSPTKSASLLYRSPDAVFGYSSNDITGTVAGASSKPSPSKKKPEPKPAAPAEKCTSKWAWLRPAGPRVAKPTATVAQTVTPSTAPAARTTAHTYIDPFLLHAIPSPTSTHVSTPTTSRPSSPKKLTRPHLPASSAEKQKFESGFAQIKSFTSLILKLCLLVYALVGLYFLLDAIREAVHALGAPFRGAKWVGRWVWVCGVWMAKVGGRLWER